jgi:hypothetical protein
VGLADPSQSVSAGIHPHGNAQAGFSCLPPVALLIFHIQHQSVEYFTKSPSFKKSWSAFCNNFALDKHAYYFIRKRQ